MHEQQQKGMAMTDAIIRSLKNAKLSEMLLVEVARTGSVKAAFDAVMGDGAYEKLANDLYRELNAKNA